MRDALPDAELYVDANRGWTVEQALPPSRALVELGVRAIEEPIDVRDTEGRLRVAAASPVPLAGDESCTSLEAVAAARDEGAIGQVSIKAARTGFTESRRIAAFCTGSELAGRRGVAVRGRDRRRSRASRSPPRSRPPPRAPPR